ncbi:MAG: PqqD family protein [Proteobacteria bacterium]|nr:PqqD family protein [Pseudomonadota bacterium]
MPEQLAPGSSTKLNGLIRRADRVAWRNVDGRAVLVIIDRQELHALNDVGSRVWELADRRSIREIAVRLAEEFEVDCVKAEADARCFVERLHELGALQCE